MLLRYFFLISILAMCLFENTIAIAGVPDFVTYSGRLTDGTGWGQSTTIDLTVRVYGSAEDDDVLWQGEYEALVIEDGYFSLLLGDGDDPNTQEVENSYSITDVFAGEPDTWLTLCVGEHPCLPAFDLSPRSRVGSVPYSVRASMAQSSLTADFSTQSGYALDAKSVEGETLADLDDRYAFKEHDHNDYVQKGESEVISGDMIMPATIPLSAIAVDDGICTATASEINWYVDPDLGTDDIAHGNQPGEGAFKTIQYAIDRLPKRLDHDVSIQLADAVYSPPDPIEIHGFVGAGRLSISGDESEVPEAGHYQVNMNFDVLSCACQVSITGLYIDATNRTVDVVSCQYVQISRCVLHGPQLAAYFSNSHGIVASCDVIGSNYGIKVVASIVRSKDNYSSSSNSWSLNADSGIIFKTGTQPSGNENTKNGGQIW